jgi:hypothetical protein
MLFKFGTDRIADFLNGADDTTLAHYATDHAVEVSFAARRVIAQLRGSQEVR